MRRHTMRVSAVPTDPECRAPGRRRCRAPLFPAGGTTAQEKSRGLRGTKLIPCKRRNARPSLLGASRGSQRAAERRSASNLHEASLRVGAATWRWTGPRAMGVAQQFPSLEAGYFERNGGLGVERHAFRGVRRTERVSATPCSSAGPTAFVDGGYWARLYRCAVGGGKGAGFVLDLALLVNEVGVASQRLGTGRWKGVRCCGRVYPGEDEEIRCQSDAPSARWDGDMWLPRLLTKLEC